MTNDWDEPIVEHVFVPSLGYKVAFCYTKRKALRFRLACLGWPNDQLDALVDEHIARVQKSMGENSAADDTTTQGAE
ncbi:MAG: hypothetical protein KDE53_35400 [Caldilineaceae bacterium]|nr:hypothetical protein [Caldilineaceae bacterium]